MLDDRFKFCTRKLVQDTVQISKPTARLVNMTSYLLDRRIYLFFFNS